MITFDESTKEFIARNIADLGKAILTVGFASYFFERLPLYLRVTFPVSGAFFVLLGVLVHAVRKGGKK